MSGAPSPSRSPVLAPVGGLHRSLDSLTTFEPSHNPAHTVSASVRPSTTEQDVDDECPTLRMIPIGRRDPSPDTEGAIVVDGAKFVACVPGHGALGTYSTRAQAQYRLDQYFGRALLAKTGVRARKTRGEK